MPQYKNGGLAGNPGNRTVQKLVGNEIAKNDNDLLAKNPPNCLYDVSH
jgi:hypothetical protein